jgi:S-formylglutathione hydrolase FrmB
MTSFRTIEVSDAALAPPGLRFVTVKSPALGQRADLTLYVPPQAEGRSDVPIVTLLHGVYGSHWSWAFKGGAHLTAQRLVDAGELPPVVLAMPSDGLWGDGSGYVRHAAQDFERWIVDEVPAAVQQACAACGPGSPQCIAGLSMGGLGALRLAARHPGRYVAAAGHSSVTEAAQLDALIAEARLGWAAGATDESVLAAWCAARRPLPALRFDCGLDDALLGSNRRLHEALDAAGIAHDYAEYPGGHDWTYWGRHLEDSLRFFGLALRQHRPA